MTQIIEKNQRKKEKNKQKKTKNNKRAQERKHKTLIEQLHKRSEIQRQVHT